MIPTASTLWLAELCPASHVLPQVRETSAEQRIGTIVHRYLERVPVIGQAAALDEAPTDTRELLSEIIIERIPTGRRELALAYNLDTRQGRELGEGIGREYPGLQGELYGTVDVLQNEHRRGAVIDYKTGQPGPAADSLQLQALALAAARTFGWSEVATYHVRIDGEGMFWDGAEVGLCDLPVIHDRVERIMRGMELAIQQHQKTGLIVHPGTHCSMCQAMPSCPATSALTLTVHNMAHPGSDITTGIEAAPAAAYAFLKRAEDFTDRLRAELKRRVELGPVPTSGGKQLAIVEVPKKTIDAKLALPVIREALGQAAADGCCEVSSAALTRAAGKKGAAALLKRIEGLGGVAHRTERHMKEVKIPARELAGPGFPTLLPDVDPEA